MVRALKDGSLILSMTRLPKMTVHSEKNPRKLAKMKSPGRSDRTQPQRHCCHIQNFPVHLICSSTQTKIFLSLKSEKHPGPQFIANSGQVCPCSFNITIHKVNSKVANKILSMTGVETRTIMEFTNVWFLKQSQLWFMFYFTDNFLHGKNLTFYFTELCRIVPSFGTCLTFHRVYHSFLHMIQKETSRLHQHAMSILLKG